MPVYLSYHLARYKLSVFLAVVISIIRVSSRWTKITALCSSKSWLDTRLQGIQSFQGQFYNSILFKNQDNGWSVLTRSDHSHGLSKPRSGVFAALDPFFCLPHKTASSIRQSRPPKSYISAKNFCRNCLSPNVPARLPKSPLLPPAHPPPPYPGLTFPGFLRP